MLFENKATTFAITDTKLSVSEVTLTTEDNLELLIQLKSGFKRTINWNKYQSKLITQAQSHYLDYLVDSSFQGVNRLCVLSLENEVDWIGHTGYYLPKVLINDYNVMIYGKNVFDQPINNDIKTYEYKCYWSKRWLHDWLFTRLSLKKKLSWLQ